MAKKTIVVHTSNASLAKKVREEFDGKTCKVDVELDVSHMPKRADLVLSSTPSTSVIEWTAARLGCYVAIIPESFDYIRGLLDKQDALVLVGADRGKA